MYSNNTLNFQESTTILNTHPKKDWKLFVCTSYYQMLGNAENESTKFTENNYILT